MSPVQPPWVQPLTQAQHDLILFGLMAAALGLLATLVRVRFTARESHGAFRVASLTANAVVSIAFASYVVLILTFLLGYREIPSMGSVLYEPLPAARYVWAVRYVDWVVTVPLLVLELAAVSALRPRALVALRRVGVASAILMIVCGFLGGFVLDDGRDLVSYAALGGVAAVFFAVLYGLFFSTMLRSLPRLPEEARSPYRRAIVLLLVIWLLYPIVYGFCGVLFGGAVAVASQLLLCAADMIAKIGFGTLVHRTAVLRSRSDEDLDPSAPPRPRAPVNDSIYVTDSRALDVDRR